MKRFNFRKLHHHTNAKRYRQCQRIGHVMPYDQRNCKACGHMFQGKIPEGLREPAPYKLRRFPRWFRKFQNGRGTQSACMRMERGCQNISGGLLLTPEIIRAMR